MILVRYSGEICIKARRTRERFTKVLARNIRDALTAHEIEFRLEREWSRILIDTESEAAAEIVSRVFGVSSVSPAVARPWTEIEDLVATGEELFRDEVKDRKFAVRARRSGEKRWIPFPSTDVERQLGAALLDASAGVDLSHPEVTAALEIHPETAYFFTRKIPGPSGLPLKAESRALGLVSGGFDSAVASWMILKRGVALDYVFFNLGGYAHEQGVLQVMKLIGDKWSYGDKPKLYSVDLRPVAQQLQERTTPRYWQVILKRLMYRGGAQLARRIRRPAIVTGEAVGQVSSQTLQNLAVISAATDTLVLRPLVGFNKEDIVQMAREIGTFDISAAVDEYCALLPRQVSTRAGFEAVAAEEAKLDPDLLHEAVRAAKAIDLRSLSPDELFRGDLEVDELPADAVVIDLRPRSAYDRWHIPGALWLDFLEAQKAWAKFDRKQTYLLCCEVGLKSAHLSELMHDEGFEAFNLKGGLARFRRAQPTA